MSNSKGLGGWNGHGPRLCPQAPSEAPGPAHPCDDPSLSATQFLCAIYRDPTFPVATRIRAASLLLPLTESVPRAMTPEPRCTIVIGGIPTEAQDHDNRKTQLKDSVAEDNHRPFMTTPGPSYIEKTLEHLPLDEIIKIVARTDPDSLPLCRCGHRMFFPCSCPPAPLN